MNGGVLGIGGIALIYAATRILFRDPGGRISDVLTTAAQADVGLLIALALERRPEPAQQALIERAVEYGTVFAISSLLLALSELWRPESKAAAGAAVFLMFLSAFALLIARFGPGAAEELAELKEMGLHPDAVDRGADRMRRD